MVQFRDFPHKGRNPVIGKTKTENQKGFRMEYQAYENDLQLHSSSQNSKQERF